MASPKIKGISFKQNNGFDISVDNQIILERVGRIIMTSKLERVNNPTFGSYLKNMLFERGNMLVQHVENSLISIIEAFEPRVMVSSARVKYKKDEAEIHIELIRRDTFDRLDFEEYILL